MRIIYFLLMTGMMLLLVVLVDWPEKLDDLPGSDVFQNFFVHTTDTAGTVSDTDLAWSDSLAFDAHFPDPGLDLDLPPLPGNNIYDLLAPPDSRISAETPKNDIDINRSTPRLAAEPIHDSEKPGHLPPAPHQRETEFQDVSEEPYLQESRKLLGQIHRNYDRIIHRPDSNAVQAARSR